MSMGLCPTRASRAREPRYKLMQNFKKPTDIFWLKIERKRSKEYLVIILAVKRKLWANFLPRVHVEKKVNTGKPAYDLNLQSCLYAEAYMTQDF